MNEEKYKRDIEESDKVIDRYESDPVDFWEQKQRELVTNTVDYNLTTLKDLIESEAIDLKPKYQRRFRWDEIRQSQLIESFLMNIPLPPIFLNEDKYGQYSVIDGKQRLMSIYEFMRGRLELKGLELFSDINGLTIDSLPKQLRTVLRTRPTLRTIIILRQSDEDIKFEVFKRLNTGGMRCNPQEIRNSAYTGNLNDLILDLSVNKQFHKLLGIKNKEKSAIYKEMRDAELVLRYFTFKDNWQDFSGALQRNMDNYMARNKNMSEDDIKQLENNFLHTINTIEACFGQYSFNRWQPDKQKWSKQVLASLYDAQIFACMNISSTKAYPKQDEIISEVKKLFENQEFRKHIDSATNGVTAFRRRIEIMKNMLERIIY